MREVPGSSPGNRLFFCFLEALWGVRGVRGGCDAQKVQERVEDHGTGTGGEQRDEIAFREKWRC